MLVVIEINGVRLTGYWFPDVDGVSWLIQPHRWIRIDDAASVVIIEKKGEICDA